MALREEVRKGTAFACARLRYRLVYNCFPSVLFFKCFVLGKQDTAYAAYNGTGYSVEPPVMHLSYDHHHCPTC